MYTILKDKLFQLKSVKYMEDRITKDYGLAISKKVHRSCYLYYKKYYKEADFRNNKAVEAHLTRNILPILSFYKALQREGIEKAKAYELICQALVTYAQRESALMKKLRYIPFFLFRYLIKIIMKNNYPTAGWEITWKRDDNKEIAFNITKCVYFDTFQKYGSLELTAICCSMDNIVYGRLSPKIQFKRTKTLAEGGSCCDFRLLHM